MSSGPAVTHVTKRTRRDLDMRGLTVATIEALQRRLIAAVHDDHTDKRHVHVIALVNRPLYGRDFIGIQLNRYTSLRL